MKLIHCLRASSWIGILALMIIIVGMPLLIGSVWTHPYIEHIPFGVLDEDGSALSRGIVRQLQTNHALSVSYFASSETDLEHAITSKKISGGIIIPRNFSRDFALQKSPTVAILSDGTNMLLGTGAASAAATAVSTVAAGAQVQLLEAGSMPPSAAATALGTFSFTERTVFEPQGSYTRRMLYTVVPLVTMQLFLLRFFVPMMLMGREEYISCTSRREAKRITANLLLRFFIVTAAVLLASFLSLCLLNLVLHLPLRGDIGLYFVCMTAMLLNITAFGMAGVGLVRKMKNFNYLQQVVAMIVMLHVFMAGMVYPISMMPRGLQLLDRAVFPLTNMAMALKALNLKGIGWSLVLPDLVHSLLYTVIWTAFGLTLYIRGILHARRRHTAALTKRTST